MSTFTFHTTTDRESLQAQLASHRAALEAAQAQLEQYTSREVIDAEAVLEGIDSVLPEQLRPQGVHKILQNYLRDLIGQYNNNTEVLIAQAREQIEYTSREIANIQRELDKPEPPAPTLNREQALEALAKYSVAVPNSLELTPETISFELHNIIMRPNHNPYPKIDGGQIPYIRLGGILVQIHAHGNIEMHPGTNGHTIPGYDGEDTVHPHVLDLSPCFGDFHGPITETFNSGDLPSLIGLLVAFLEQADNQDSAGQYWVRFFEHDYCFDGDYLDGTYTTTPDGEIHWN